LLFNPQQTGQLIDECAAIISQPDGGPSMVDADRAKWDYHPIMARTGGKAGQGLFYQAAPGRDFRGMVQLMKDYAKSRASWIDATLLNDGKIPATPILVSAGSPSFPAKELSFRCSEFSGATGFAAMKWRLGEVAEPTALAGKPSAPLPYEITPVWESAEMRAFAREMVVPPDAVRVAHTYRVRVRMKDTAGRWSHWSAPIQFKASAPLN